MPLDYILPKETKIERRNNMELYQYIIIITVLLLIAIAIVKGNKKDGEGSGK